MAPQTAAAAPHQAQPASTIQPVKDSTSAWLLARKNARAAAAVEQQAWQAYITGLPSGAQPRLCQDCDYFVLHNTACRKIITAIDPVFGPRLANCHDARKSDGPCGFTATLFVHPSNNPPADVTDLGHHLGNTI